MELLFSVSLAIFIAAALLFGYYSLQQRLRDQARLEMGRLSAELRQLESSLRSVRAASLAYSQEDPEPYGAKAVQISQGLEQVSQALTAAWTGYIALQEQLRQHTRRWYGLFLISPFRQTRLRREAENLRIRLEQQAGSLAEVEGLNRELDQMSWRIAGEARQMAAAQLKRMGRIQALGERKVHGAAFTDLESQAVQIEVELAKIPALFLDGSEAELNDQAERQAVIAVYQILTQVYPAGQQVDERLGGWERQLAALDERFSSLRRCLSDAEQTLTGLPAGLERAEFETAYHQFSASFNQLHNRVMRPELEKLKDFQAQAEHQIQVLQEYESRLRAAQQSLLTLKQNLQELGEAQKGLSAQYAALGTDRKHRVTWSSTSARLARLSQQLSDLGSPELLRTPHRITDDLEKVRLIAQGQQELAATLSQVSSQQRELSELIDAPELSQALLWAQNAQTVLQQTHRYHADNWPRADGLANLPAEISSLIDELRPFGSGWPAEGIPEEQLGMRLDLVRRLGARYQALRSRLALIETRLAELQQAEKQAGETLQNTRKTLLQAGLIINSNLFLSGIAAKDVERFTTQLDKQLAELDQRQQGTVDSKARQAAGLRARLEQGVNQWLDQLSRATEEKIKALTVSLTRLDSIASLEDAPVTEARRLLAATPPSLSGMPGEPARFDLERGVLELKRLSEYHQSCLAGAQALSDLEKPIVESYQIASQKRQEVQTTFDTISTWLRQTRAWPPVAVNIETEYNQFGALGSSWNSLKNQPLRAIELVKQLGDFGRNYQELGEKMRQLSERGNREQNEIKKLENELQDYLHKWERLLEKYPDQAEVVEEIRGLLDDSDLELFQVKARYRDGAIDYEDAFQKVQNLERKVRLFQVALDETHTLDVNGRVITSRDSTRAPGEW